MNEAPKEQANKDNGTPLDKSDDNTLLDKPVVTELSETGIDGHATDARNVDTDAEGVMTSSQGGTVLLTRDMMRATDEDGDRSDRPIPTDNDPANVHYIITGYENADYHQGAAPAGGAQDARKTKQGWVERWTDTDGDGQGDSWVRLDPLVAANGFTGRMLVDADGDGEGTALFAYDDRLVDFDQQIDDVQSRRNDANVALTITIDGGNVYIGSTGAAPMSGAQDATLTNADLHEIAIGQSKIFFLVADINTDTVKLVTELGANQFLLGQLTVIANEPGQQGVPAFTATLSRNDGMDVTNGMRLYGDSSFTQKDVDDGLIRFVHSGDDSDDDNDAGTRETKFSYRLRDGAKDKAKQKIGGVEDIAITVTNTNDKPFVDAKDDDGNARAKAGRGCAGKYRCPHLQ